jgi:hypothetical protein
MISADEITRRLSDIELAVEKMGEAMANLDPILRRIAWTLDGDPNTYFGAHEVTDLLDRNAPLLESIRGLVTPQVPG